MSASDVEGAKLLAGVAFGFVCFVALLVAPLLFRTRLVVHLRVVDANGRPRPGVPVDGSWNRTGAASGATGEGFLAGRQLDAVRGSLGTTDSEGTLRTTLYLRNAHTLFVGAREIFLTDTLKSKMRSTVHEVRLDAP